MNEIKRQPTSLGEILKEEFLIPMNLTQSQLAKHIGCDVKVINRIIGRTSVTADLALKFGATFKTTPVFWLNAQKTVDHFNAKKGAKLLPKPIEKVV